VSRIRKKTFYLKFCMETPEYHQKSKISTSKVKKAKNSYRIGLMEIAGSTHNNKKIIETPNSPIETKTSLKFFGFFVHEINSFIIVNRKLKQKNLFFVNLFEIKQLL
jgi:hypothetical protein